MDAILLGQKPSLHLPDTLFISFSDVIWNLKRKNKS